MQQANVPAFALVLGQSPRVRVTLRGAARDCDAVEYKGGHRRGRGTAGARGVARSGLTDGANAYDLLLGPIPYVEHPELGRFASVGGDEDVLEDGDVLERAVDGARVGLDLRTLYEGDVGVILSLTTRHGTVSWFGDRVGAARVSGSFGRGSGI